MNQQNIGVSKNNKLGIKHIRMCGKGYRFSKETNGERHQKWFKTLEDAIKYKEEYLN